MKLFLVLGLIVAVSALEPIYKDFHNDIDIPAAARIKQAEESVDFDGARIAGGSSITWTISLYVCGSSLISNTRLVTAAHCWKHFGSQATSITVVLGSIRLYSGGNRINTSNIRMHGSYNEHTLANDIAIIIINHVGYNNNIRNIQLASGNNQYVGVWASAAGFGITGDGSGVSQTLNHVNLQVITNNVCAFSYPNNVIFSTLCIGSTSGRSTCASDSAGPLAIGNGNSRELIGVKSFGHAKGCTNGHPAGFARVTSFNS